MSEMYKRHMILVSMFMLLCMTGCGGRGVEKTASAGMKVKAVPVTVSGVTVRPVERTVEVVGTLKGWEEVKLGAKKGGRVVRVLHDMGDHVKPGEKLVELDTVDARLGVAQAKSKYLADLARLGMTQDQAETSLKRFGVTEELLLGEAATKLIEKAPAIVQANVAVERAKNNLARLRMLNQRGAGTLEELQNVENDFKAAEAARDTAVTTARNIIATAVSSKLACDLAEQGLKDMTVVAPEPSKVPEGVTGKGLIFGVSKRSAAEGQILKDGDEVYGLVIENPLRLWVNVPERHSSEVKLGQAVRIKVSSFSEMDFEGTVARINPSVDPMSRTFQVEAVVPNNRGLLRPGGFAKASIVTERNGDATVVPVESVMKYAGVTKVFVVEGGKARSVNVETGQEGKGWVEVIGKLPEKGRVVVTGQTQLADGTEVVVREADVEK